MFHIILIIQGLTSFLSSLKLVKAQYPAQGHFRGHVAGAEHSFYVGIEGVTF